MMTIEQRIMAGEDSAKIMQEIELAKKKKAAADEHKKAAARKASEEQLKKARENLITAAAEYLGVLGFPQSILNQIIEDLTEEDFKDIEFKFKMLIPLATAMEEMSTKPKQCSKDKAAK